MLFRSVFPRTGFVYLYLFECNLATSAINIRHSYRGLIGRLGGRPASGSPLTQFVLSFVCFVYYIFLVWPMGIFTSSLVGTVFVCSVLVFDFHLLLTACSLIIV